jgi:hypothetical protein
MARKTQLLSLIAQLRAETGRTQTVSVGIDEVENLKEMLRRVQEQLYDEYDWPHLRVQKTVALAAGQRYYDLPTGLNFDRIEDVRLEYNDVYQGIDRGIELEDYSIFNSNASTPERSSPSLKWDIRYTGSTEQIEVWPIPNDNIQTLYFLGTQSLSDLIQESDRADLDDRLIVLYAAAEILARQESKDAQAKLEQANKRLATLRKNSIKKAPMIQMGLGRVRGTDRNKVKIVVS